MDIQLWKRKDTSNLPMNWITSETLSYIEPFLTNLDITNTTCWRSRNLQLTKNLSRSGRRDMITTSRFLPPKKNSSLIDMLTNLETSYWRVTQYYLTGSKKLLSQQSLKLHMPTCLKHTFLQSGRQSATSARNCFFL